MVLKIGDNIRTLRRKADMTQEQLAEKLGTSPQSVSRWENGITYPDLEFLPALARIFSVTTDELLNCPDKEKEKQCEELGEKIRAAYKNRDSDAAVRILQEIRRDHIDFLVSSRLSPEQWRVLSSVYNVYYRDCDIQWLSREEILEQLRLLTEEILSANNKSIKEYVLEVMAILEDDEHIDAFLKANSTNRDFSKDTLLEQRYRSRQEFDKLNLIREKFVYSNFQKFFSMISKVPFRRKEASDIEQLIWKYNFYFSTLHALRKITPDPLYPVSGNGTADAWAGDIISSGIQYANALAASDEPEQAFTVLDDVISLAEKIWALPEMTELSFSTPAIETNKAIVLRGKFTRTDTGYTTSYNSTKGWKGPYNIIHLDSPFLIYTADITPILICHYLKKEDRFFEGFAKISTDPRFEGYLNRMQTLLDIGANPQET